MTSGRMASSSTASITSGGVTHTGQPGPLRSCTFSGSAARRADFAMAMVCVPHTSISFTLPTGSAAIAESIRLRASEMSERIDDLPPAFKILQRLPLAETLYGKARVHDDVFAEPGRVDEIDAQLAPHAHRLADGALAVYLHKLQRYCKTHNYYPLIRCDSVLSVFKRILRYHQLTERQPLVICGYAAVTVHIKALAPQPRGEAAHNVHILKASAGKNDAR